MYKRQQRISQGLANQIEKPLIVSLRHAVRHEIDSVYVGDMSALAESNDYFHRGRMQKERDAHGASAVERLVD